MADRTQRPAAALTLDRWTILCLVLGLLGLSGAPLTAQEPADPSTDFFETIEVEIVNVEVYVTDKDGQPVRGLTPDEFEVFEDGDKVEVVNFYAAEGGQPTARVAADATSAEAASEPAPIKPPDQRLNLILFIDNLNVSPQGRNRVLEALRGSLFFQLKPDDRVLLVSYDGSLQIRQSLTNDPDTLATVLDEMVVGSAQGVHAGFERSAILRELQQADLDLDTEASFGPGANRPAGENLDGLAQNLLSSIRTYSQIRFRQVVETIQTLERFAETLAGLEGRKALVYVSDGLSLRPGEALYEAWENRFREILPDLGGFTDIRTEARDTDATALFEQLGRVANANQVTFHTILASGDRNPARSLAERRAIVGINATDLGQVWNDRLESIERSNTRGSLQILASATGGVSTFQTNNIGSALQRLKRDLDTYYSLGYVPNHDDNESHRIQVRVSRPGVQVRHRESYQNKTADERMTGEALSALFFDGGSNPLGVRVGFGEGQRNEKGQFLVPVLVKFPIAKVLLLPQEHFHEGRVSIFVGARDGRGRTSPIQKMPAPIRIPNDQLLTALGQVAGYRMTLLLEDGEHSVVVGVRDELANVSSTTTMAHDPGDP